MFSADDEKYMKMALSLARKGLGYTRPNPLVGAILVKDGKIIGKGWHQHFGGPHAEVNCFRNCHENPAGATLYVSLEPCSHYGKTPPCVDLVIRKKVGRVVTAMMDPNPLVAGNGIRKLQAAGISVTVGVLEKEARKLNEVFIKYITTHRPFVLYKAAMSLDGKIACYTGESQWISSPESREESHVLRGALAGIMVGAGTVRKDNPFLTARVEGLPDPVRIVVDGRLSIPLDANVVTEKGQTVIITTESASLERAGAFEKKGVTVIKTQPQKDGRADLSEAMEKLGGLGIDGILLEGGGTLAASCFEANIIDKVRFYVAPMIIGGKDAPGLIGGRGAAHLSEAVHLSDLSVRQVGPDAAIEGYVHPENMNSSGKEEAAQDDVHGND